ncbi:MAG: DUF2378 family protein [Myxococcales bacterium]|nr:DUF2378 family protein [Myxococcales bacterium]
MTHEVSHAMFEGLFARAVTVSAELARELKACGYDVKNPDTGASGAVFSACVEAGRRSVHPTKSPDEGQRELGRAFVRGFRETILGRVLTTALPILGPVRFLPRVPGRLASLRRDATVTVTVTGATSASLQFADLQQLSSFFAGVIEGALLYSKARSPRVVVTLEPGGYRLDATWEP